MIRSTKVRWLTNEEDMKYWQIWDEKEDFMEIDLAEAEQEKHIKIEHYDVVVIIDTDQD